mgnify:FL=1
MKKKILIIEDEAHLQDVFKEIFESEGYEYVFAYDGETGIKMAENESPDFIILDLILPKKDGFEVLQELKNNPKTSKIPMAVLSNLEGSHDIEKVFSLGVSNYFVKSRYTPQEISEKIKKIMGK